MRTKTRNEIRLTLFISGMSVKSIRAIENIKSIVEEYLPGACDLEIIDLNKEREKAAEFQIVALPTLIKNLPSPKRIILGDLSDKKKILKVLDIETKE